MEFKPIGIIHTPFQEPSGMPIQPAGGADIEAEVEIFPEFHPGLKDLEGFSHVVLLYHFHRSDGYKMEVVPYMDTELRGVFATRAPRRPNPIGLSTVRLIAVEQGMIRIQGVDMLDGTPLLDIKPYVPEFDRQEEVRTGWLENSAGTVGKRKSDDRFR